MNMIRLISLTLAMTLIMTTPTYAGIIKYSEETRKLMEEAGLELDNDWEEISRRQDEYKKRQKNKKNSANISEPYVPTGSQYSSYGAKYSYDEFHTVPIDIPANDGYRSGGFDELHINENYRQNVWHPKHRGSRIEGFDEFRFPDEM
ncbi:MAG: hypothetical protein K5668_01135 [Lachnospiraceae bacterium]|nr:hypothetical protein [Lachnospiraceae bacterium]